MDDRLIKELIKYVKDTLDIALIIKPWNDGLGLPFFLKEQYAFYQTKIMALPCILMVSKDKPDTTPALVRKHIDHLYPQTIKFLQSQKAG